MSEAAQPRASSGAAPWLLGLVVIALAVLGFTLLPLGRWALWLVEWVRGAGVLGVVAFVTAYVAATALALPGSILTLGAGFVYGPLYGTLLVSPTSVLAATVAFLLGRFVARGWVARKVEGDERFSAIDAAVGESGFKVVTLLRLSPVIPFNILNYALGLTRVRTRDYVLGSWLGMLPATVLYVYLGSVITSASQLASGSRPDAGVWGRVLYWGGLVATLVVTVMVTRMARRALRSTLQVEPEEGSNP